MPKAGEPKVATPANRWREQGLADPFGNRYECAREDTVMGHLTDDELANEVFLCNHRTSFDSIGLLTAAKDRIRWLSRELERVKAAANPASDRSA